MDDDTQRSILQRRMGRLDFTTRYLVEGLVSHGIILPFERKGLLDVLDNRLPLDDMQTVRKTINARQIPGWISQGYEHGTVEELREKVLASLFTEERIKNLDAVIRGMCSSNSPRCTPYLLRVLYR